MPYSQVISSQTPDGPPEVAPISDLAGAFQVRRKSDLGDRLFAFQRNEREAERDFEFQKAEIERYGNLNAQGAGSFGSSFLGSFLPSAFQAVGGALGGGGGFGAAVNNYTTSFINGANNFARGIR